ncbi:SGSM3 [Cordylochernes scorpioides]|uniref:SGSM3 n=1 Tax=Cordylochernes scorpioides TaxID=51811 RepID=A0ABY6KU40_9ARAC|nr:SGSM3 [Cordylochernes scorpioides]
MEADALAADSNMSTDAAPPYPWSGTLAEESTLSDISNSAQFFNALSDIPGDIDDIEDLLEMAFHSALTTVMIDTQRRKHLAYLMADQGALLNPENTKNLPKQASFCCYRDGG